MRLYLVQHGEALSKDLDPARPLSEAGTRDVQDLANFLAATGLRVDKVTHSGKRRAEQTAEILAAALALPGALAAEAGLAPNDPVDAFARAAGAWQEDRLVVGHLPFMDRALSLLTAGRDEAGIAAFRPGSIAGLERDAAGGWSLAWMLRPELLRPGQSASPEPLGP